MTKGLFVAIVLAVLAVVANAETCWRDAEGTGNGVTKDCWYQCIHGRIVRSVPANQRCPLSVEVDKGDQ